MVFAAWLEAGDAHTQWAELTWLIAQALPLLLTIIRMVPATDDADMLRYGSQTRSQHEHTLYAAGQVLASNSCFPIRAACCGTMQA